MPDYCGQCRRPLKEPLKSTYCCKNCEHLAEGKKPDPSHCWICGREKKARHHKYCGERCRKIGDGTVDKIKAVPVISNTCFPKTLIETMLKKRDQLLNDKQFLDAWSLGKNASIAAISVGVSSYEIENPKVTLVLEQRNNGFSFGLPGGSREENEDLLSTAMREWREETGICFTDFLDVDITYQFNSNGADIIIMIFVKQLDIRNVVNVKSSLHTEHIPFTIIDENKKKNVYYHVEQKVDKFGQQCGGIEPCNCLDKTNCVRFRIRQCMYHGWDEVVAVTKNKPLPSKKFKIDIRL